MKDIYLSEEGKKEIEAKLKQIRINDRADYESDEDYLLRKHELEQNFIDDVISSATILPVEESWEDVEFFPPDNESQTERVLRFKNGVIIK